MNPSLDWLKWAVLASALIAQFAVVAGGSYVLYRVQWHVKCRWSKKPPVDDREQWLWRMPMGWLVATSILVVVPIFALLLEFGIETGVRHGWPVLIVAPVLFVGWFKSLEFGLRLAIKHRYLSEPGER